jgi:hypothetical protein
MQTSGLLRLREPSVAQCSRFVLSTAGGLILLSIEVFALPPQIPDKDPNAQQQDDYQGHGQGCRLTVDPAA